MAEKFVERRKLSKKARRALDSEGRARWAFSPVTRRVESKKHYSRKRDRMPGAYSTPRDFSFYYIPAGDVMPPEAPPPPAHCVRGWGWGLWGPGPESPEIKKPVGFRPLYDREVIPSLRMALWAILPPEGAAKRFPLNGPEPDRFEKPIQRVPAPVE